MVELEREQRRLCEIQERLFFLAEKLESKALSELAEDLDRFEENHPELTDSV